MAGMNSLHCIPIQAASMKEWEERVRAAQGRADLIEVWLDSIRDVRLAEIFFLKDEINLPFLVVNKTPAEGGKFMGTPEARVEFLEEALKRGAEYVDVALDTDPKLIKKLVRAKEARAKGARTKGTGSKRGGAKERAAKAAATLILSYHNFKETPPLDELKRLVEDARRKGADMVKVSTFVADVSDNVVLLDLLRWAHSEKISLIVVGMGDKGTITRVIAPLLGSPLYYAPVSDESHTAPGQLTKRDLDSIWNHLNL